MFLRSCRCSGAGGTNNLSPSNSIATRHYSSNLSSSNSITTRHYSSKPWYCSRCSFAWYCSRCSFAWYCSRCSFACDFSSRFSLFFWFSSSTQVFASNPKFRLTSNTLCMIIDFQEKPSKPLSMV